MPKEIEEKSFWEKVKKYAVIAGREVIEKALWLYYTAQDPKTPPWAKGIIYGALVYFILPADAIPDAIPVVGFTDDLGALAAAVASVSLFITAEIKEKSTKKLSEWFK